MNPVVLLYAENVISRPKRRPQQRLVFCIEINDLGFGKTVDILWAGEDGQWHILSAHYQHRHREGAEHWRAEATFTLAVDKGLPGNIRFCVRCSADGKEFWDNNQGQDYQSEADSGVLLGRESLQLMDYRPVLDHSSAHLLLRVATASHLQAERLLIKWSRDDWHSHELIECQKHVDEWDRYCRSNARNPNQYAVNIWSTSIDCDNVFRLQYRIGYQRAGETIWDDNQRYICSRPPLRLMILNLHCYQEQDQMAKLQRIARAIEELEVDIVCLQEVAEHWNDGHGDWQSNTARIINEQLPRAFHLHCDWSHRGFDRYREGVAILTRHAILDCQSRYVSNSHDMLDIHSRKVVMTTVDAPCFGKLNVYSAHLSWMEDGFTEQFRNLQEWAAHNSHDDTAATLLCGDFNVTVGSGGYRHIVEGARYDDQFLQANHEGLFEKIFRNEDPYWQELSSAEYRIDYVFMNRDARLKVTRADVLFTEHDYGRVSDHCGYLFIFEPKVKPINNPDESLNKKEAQDDFC